ncbi:hypothetical protein [Thiothrix fructosivorans]|nr:hypothetical protein [Thiothrix fructosivorans]MBO0611721.1 hypothetical protein [Thiothrix fructosivorans]
MIDRKAFYNALRYKRLFLRGIPQAAVDGVNAILNEWETGEYGDDLQHLSYALAVTYHETDGRMEPIEEYGRGAGKPYGNAYGRAFVQITWHTNYAKFGRILNIPLATNYSLALNPVYAAKILLIGMRDGLFRKHKLSDFDFTSAKGVFDARNIINGDKTYSDKKTTAAGVANRGELVAGYYATFFDALTNAYVSEPIMPNHPPLQGASDEPVVITEPDFSNHPKYSVNDDLPELPAEYYAWVAEKRKERQAEAYKELNQKPLVKSSVTGFVAAGFVSVIATSVSQHFGIEIPSEAKDWLYGGIIAVMGGGALWGRAKATTFINGFIR